MAEYVRLLFCHDCESVDEIPWCGESPECRHPECEGPLLYRQSQHWFDPDHSHKVALAGVEKAVWEDPAQQRNILSQIRQAVKPGSATGLGETFYDVKSTFADDAMTCWKQHNRTQDCGDYKSPSKYLKPDTRGERRELGLDPVNRPGFFLCDFCPVKSIVQTKVYSDKFGYNNPY